MKQKKLLTLFLTVATSFSMLVACSNATFAESTGTATVTESTNTTDKKQKADENQDAAKQLLVDLTGSYQELWPVILDEKYQQIWIDDCTELVGEENAEAAYDKLASMVSGTIYGEEAVEAYKDGDGVSVGTTVSCTSSVTSIDATSVLSFTESAVLTVSEFSIATAKETMNATVIIRGLKNLLFF